MFYSFIDDDANRGWIEWSSYFVDGVLKELHLLRHEEPKGDDAVDPHVADTGKTTTRVEVCSGQPVKKDKTP